METATQERAVIEHEPQLPVAQPSPAVTPMALIERAMANGASMEQLEKLLDLQERWEKNEARKAFHLAFSAFKAEAVRVIRNKPVNDGPLKGKRYADLFAVVDAVTPPLAMHGLSTSWRLSKDEKDWLEVTCTITHTLGHSESVSMGAMPDSGGAKNGIQARASSVTYLERYTLMAACGLAARDTDDDGRGAGHQEPAVEADPEGKQTLEACGSMRALTEAWNKLPKEKRATLAAVMNECRTRIKEADEAAAK